MSEIAKDSPGPGDVHVPTADWKASRTRVRKPPVKDGEVIAKSDPAPLYVYRALLNADEVIKWAKSQGLTTTLPADQMHVTIIYSKAPVDWMAMGESWSGDDKGRVTVSPGGPRVVSQFDQGAVVLEFACDTFAWRNQVMRDKGASASFEDYRPHVTLTYNAPEDFDPASIEPYQGELKFGPEIFEQIKDDGFDPSTLIEKGDGHLTFCKVANVSDELGIVFGWAVVCKVAGQDYYDLNVEKRGEAWERVPEHVPEPAMLKGAADFAKSARPGNEMHAGPDSGQFAFLMPWTAEIAKAFGYEGTPPVTGLMVGYHAEPEVLSKFKDGTYSGFSIEGSRVRSEEIA